MFKLFGKAIKATKIKNMLNFFVHDDQTDLFEGQTKQFGQDDQRQLKTGESGKKRWHNLTSEEQQDLFRVKPEQLDIFSGKKEEPEPEPEPEPQEDVNAKIKEEEPEDTRTTQEKINDLLDEKQRNKNFKDVNERVRGSKKEIMALRKLSLKNMLEKADDATAFGLVTKDKVIDDLTKEEIKQRKEAGYESGAVYMQQKLREAIRVKPENSKIARERYIELLPKLIEKIDNCKTTNELMALYRLFDWHYGQGTYVNGRYVRAKKKWIITDEDLLSEEEKQSDGDHMDEIEIDYADVLGERFFNLIGRKTDATRATWKTALSFAPYTKEQAMESYQYFLKSIEHQIDYTLQRANEPKSMDWELQHNGKYYGVYYGTLGQLKMLGRKNPDEYNALLEKMKERFLALAKELQSQRLSFDEWLGKDRDRIKPESWEWAKLDQEEEETPTKTKNKSTEIRADESIPLDYIKRSGGRAVLDNEVQAYKIIEEFDYKSLQLGNYVKDKEAKEHIRHYLGAMRDLEDILELDLKAINQQGGLSLAIGARGSGNALAHYEPAHVIINLTKKKGDGSIAHEWFHFLDHFLGGQRLSASRSEMYLSEKRGYSYYNVSKVELAFQDLFDTIRNGDGEYNEVPITYNPSKRLTSYRGVKDRYEVWKKRYAELEQKKERLKNSNVDSDIKEMLEKDYKGMEGSTPEQKTIEEYLHYSNGAQVASYVARLAGKPITVMVKKRMSKYYSGALSFKSDYWARPVELFARAFEAYIQDKLEAKGYVNNYLVAGNDSSKEDAKWSKNHLDRAYPQGDERKTINSKFDNLFKSLKIEKTDFNKKNYQKDLQEYLSIGKGMDLGVDENALRANHRAIVENAIKENKYIPNHVKADYPDLFTDGTKERANVFVDQQEDVKKSIEIRLFNKSFQIGKLPENYKSQFGEQTDMFPNMKGQERPNHKYIKREPDPNKPGKYIYYYQLPNGQVVGKDEEGKEVQSQQVEPQGDEATGQQEFPDQGNLDLFAEVVGTTEDKKTGSEREELYRQEKEEETKNLFKLYGEMARQQIQEARLSMNFYFDKMKEFSSKHGFEEPDKNNATFFVKTKDHLISEINENREKGVGRVTDGAFIHHYFGDGNTDAVIGEYEKDGYEVKPIQDEYIEPDFASYKFDKYIAEKGDERFEVWTMDKSMYQAYVDAQAKSSVRLKETKTSLALKLEAEKIPEFGMVKQKYMQRGKANKNLFVIGGLAGAGKTTVLGNTLQKSGVVIDLDSIKFDLGEIRGTDKEDIKSNPAKYHEESSVVAKHLLREMLREGKRTIFDGTMKSVPNVGDLTVLAKSAGYKTHAKFIHIPIEVGIERDRMRGERGGRSLGESLYRKLYEGYPTHKSLFALAPKFDNIDLYDNSRDAGKKAVKVYRKSTGGERILSRKRYEEIKKLGQLIKAILNFIRKSRFTK